MTHQDDRRLAQLAELVHQARMTRLSEARQRLEMLKSRIAALEPADPDLSDATLLQAQLRHRQWAAHARRKLEADLIQRELGLSQLRTDAARSFARCRAVERMIARTRQDQSS